MNHELTEIKIMRKQLGITQQELAKLAGVSQSLVAKIEANTIDPTYTKVKKIFETLYALNEKKQLRASDLMNQQLITVAPTETLKETIKKCIRWKTLRKR